MKVNKKIMERASRAIGAGESLDEIVLVLKGPKLALFFGALGMAFMKQLWVVSTGQHIYVMKPVKQEMEVQAKHALDAVDVKAKKGFPVGAIQIGPEKFWLAVGQQQKGLKIAEAAGPSGA